MCFGKFLKKFWGMKKRNYEDAPAACGSQEIVGILKKSNKGKMILNNLIYFQLVIV